MPLSSLSFTNLGPFDEVTFEFDPQVNVLVGPNNCGKSTVLLALADFLVRPFGLPMKLRRGECAEFQVRYRTGRAREHLVEGTFPIIFPDARWTEEEGKKILKIHKSFGYTAFVPALRWSTDFRSKGPGRSTQQDPEGMEAYAPGSSKSKTVLVRRHAKGLRRSDDPDAKGDASLVRDSEIVQEIIELDYAAYRQKNPSLRKLIDRVGAIASEITEGFRIKFAGIGEDERGLFPEFETPDGKVPFDVLSQGTQSLIQWLARLLIGYARHYEFPDDLGDKPGILIIDEIDAHLHPTWQRRIIPAISREFPSLQIFCSTHSPLMLAGLKAGQIHLLTRDKKGKVIASRNETDIIGWSADEIITTYLGVENATDLQTEKDLGRLRELREKKRPTPKQRKELEALRATVNRRLVGGPGAEEIDQLAERLRSAVPVPSKSKTAKPRRPKGGTSAGRTKKTTSAPRRAKK